MQKIIRKTELDKLLVLKDNYNGLRKRQPQRSETGKCNRLVIK